MAAVSGPVVCPLVCPSVSWRGPETHAMSKYCPNERGEGQQFPVSEEPGVQPRN